MHHSWIPCTLGERRGSTQKTYDGAVGTRQPRGRTEGCVGERWAVSRPGAHRADGRCSHGTKGWNRVPLEINGAGAADQTLLHLSLSEWWALTPCRLFGHSPAPRHSVVPQCPGSKVPPWQPACGSCRMRLWRPSSLCSEFLMRSCCRAPSRPADSPEPAKGLPTFHVTARGAPSAPYTVPHTSAPLC